jgi:hypothetical protein
MTEPDNVISHITNADIIGAAAFIHGYVALCGFGITLIRNQIVDVIPKAIKVILGRADFPSRDLTLRKINLNFAFMFNFSIKIILFLDFQNEIK